MNAMRILVLEDEPDLALLLKDGLQAAGYRAVSAARVAEALERLESEVFHAAVLDINIGEDLGFAVAQRLAQRDIPFLFASGNAAAVPAQYAARPFLAKPYALSELIDALGSMLADRPVRYLPPRKEPLG